MEFQSLKLIASHLNKLTTLRSIPMIIQKNGVWGRDFKKILPLKMGVGQSGTEIDHGKSIQETLLLANKPTGINQSTLLEKTKVQIGIISCISKTLLDSILMFQAAEIV